jgi:hypothetical protein
VVPPSNGIVFYKTANLNGVLDARNFSNDTGNLFEHRFGPLQRRTIAGYEAIHMIRNGQARWSAAGVKVGLLHHFIVGMFGIEA